MELDAIVNLIVNNSVSVAVIAYFCIRDWKFNDTLNRALTSLIDSTNTLKELLKDLTDKERKE